MAHLVCIKYFGLNHVNVNMSLKSTQCTCPDGKNTAESSNTTAGDYSILYQYQMSGLYWNMWASVVNTVIQTSLVLECLNICIFMPIPLREKTKVNPT